MISARTKALVLLLGLITLLLSACDDGDIHALAKGAGGCPTLEPYTVTAGTPTAEADGSLTFLASGSIRFNRTYTTSTIVSACIGFSPLGSGASLFMPLLDGPNSTMYVSALLAGSGQLDVSMGDDNAGVGCPTISFFGPNYNAGGVIGISARLDQTGAFPVLWAWVDKAPNTAPADLQSDDPGYCLADSSLNWVFSTQSEARLAATNLNLRRYGFQP